MERWFGTFKREFGNLNQFRDLAELHEAIALQVYCYNHRRIHSALGMSPAQYAETLNFPRAYARGIAVEGLKV